MEFYSRNIEETIKESATSKELGLAQKEAESRLLIQGKNELIEKGQKGFLSILFDQLKGVMVIILLVAAVVSLFLHEVVDAIVIFIIVILNTILGFWQEFKAEKSLIALKQMLVSLMYVSGGMEKYRKSLQQILYPGILFLLKQVILYRQMPG